ncbi:MAG: porin [Armatimonadota bacterium]
MKSLGIVFLAALMPVASASAVAASSHDWKSYFQLRYTEPEDASGYVGLRRLKLYGQGPVYGEWSYFLQFLYKTGNRSATDGLFLQEANIFRSAWRGKITVGQFKPPFGLERFTADWKLALIDRTQPTDRLIPNGSVGDSFARDYGLQWEGPIGHGFDLALGVFAGSAANGPFTGNGPLVVTRAAYEHRPGSDRRMRAELALSWRRDRDIDFSRQLPGAPAGYSSFRGHDNRENLVLACDVGANSLRAEYFAAQYESGRGTVPSIDAAGYYAQYARMLSSRWSAAVRLERFDPDCSVRNSKDVSWLTIGVTCYIRGDSEKVQANYILKSEAVNEIENDAFVVQYQRFF